ncbi:MAG: chemotaxis protein CheW [Steroidobacteraceae bacterium]
MAERVLEIYSLLIPLAEERLIIPRSCVAEVVAYEEPTEMAGAPPWYLGTIQWNSRSVPLVSFEALCGQPVPPSSQRARVVVFHCLGDALEGGHFAILSQGFPQLVRVSSDVIRPDNSRAIGERQPILCQVRMLNEMPLVPDLERLEELISEETSVALG